MNSVHVIPDISIVAPVYNEEGNIAALVGRLAAVMDASNLHYEIVLVDDGSSDRTWACIEEARALCAHLKGFRLSRNFGHQHALLAGLASARGRAIVSMDGDLQHPPEVIPELIEAWKSGFDVVSTKRRDEEVTGFFKRKSSQLFYQFFYWLADISVGTGTSDFRLLDRKVVEELLLLKDTDLFIRGAVEWLGFRATVVEFDVDERLSGSSKYSLRRMMRFASGAIVSFSAKPLKIGIWLGFLTSIAAFAEIGYVLWAYANGQVVPGWASILGVVSLLFGIMFIILGILGSYIARMHTALQNRPQFIISETTGGAEASVRQLEEKKTVERTHASKQ
ncbi:glycosyltransferase family 2 protein [Kordiimonas sp.]|uniref:glycosyltransferase family 2 protein n=1 Tax=Kordiimonas sp. TaxID=1970157 RepID=UPI003A91E3C4